MEGGRKFLPRKKRAPGRERPGGKKWHAAAACLLLVLVLTAGAGYGVFQHYFSLLGRMDSPGPPAASPEQGEAGLPPEREDAPSRPPATAGEIERIEEALRRNLEAMESASDLYATEAFNILLIGVDARSDTMTGRSDAMILLSIHKDLRQITMTSFLRDIYLPIPGYGSSRLNAAYESGGAELLTETLKANFGITVDRCLVVNFYLVMDLIDAVGGIDLEVTAEEIDVMNMYITSHNKLLGKQKNTDILSPEDAGPVHLNGSQALGYMRVRYVGTDFARTGRQRAVITKFLDKVRQRKLSELNALAEAFFPRVRTDLSKGDCAALLLMLPRLEDYTFRSLAIPLDGTWSDANIDGMSVLIIDFPANTEAWYEAVEGERE